MTICSSNVPPLVEKFPKRDRIVSGFSRGDLITARRAGVDQGRVVFALPRRADKKLSIRPHQLIRNGANLVTNLEGILEDCGSGQTYSKSVRD